MNIANLIYDYWYFARRYAQLSKIFYLCQSILLPECIISESSVKTLVSLNERRQNIQKEIDKLNASLSTVCSDCKGSCCLGAYNHYTAIDYWLRKYSSPPLEAFGIEMFFPWYIHLLRERLGLHINSQSKVPRNGCPYLSERGCKIEVYDRPIKCLAFTSRKLREAMSKEQRKQYKRLIEELYSISRSTFNILKKEAGIPKSYGNVSLILTI